MLGQSGSRAPYSSPASPPDGTPLAAGFPSEGGEVPFPGWDDFEDEDLADLDDATREALQDKKIPSPEHVTKDPQQLSDERRDDVPVTVVCTEFTGAMLRGWVAEGIEPVQELARIKDVEYIDVPTEHWPQVTRPAELATTLLERSPAAGDRS